MFCLIEPKHWYKPTGLRRVLDIVDYQSSQIKGKSSRVQDPAGLIIFSLENNLPIPVSFVTSRLRKEVQNKAKAADELRQRDAELRISYAESKDARLEEEFAKRFTSSELRAKIQEIILEHGKSDKNRVTLEQRQQIALQLIKKEIRDEIGSQPEDSGLGTDSTQPIFELNSVPMCSLSRQRL